MQEKNNLTDRSAETPSPTLNRDQSIDIIRGIAIFTMIAANLAGEFLKEPHPTALRFYGTFAASTFVMLAGMMAGFAVYQKEKGFNYLLKRGLFILGIAALDDILLWKLYPFMGLDVLYTIGLTMPLCYLFSQCASKIQWSIIGVLFAATPLIQQMFGYAVYPYTYETNVAPSVFFTSKIFFEGLNNWMVSGWFPIFPWFSFAFFGVALSRMRTNNSDFSLPKFGYLALGLLLGGTILWNVFPVEHLTRGGYSELFYPPTIAYILLALGVLMTLFYIVDKTTQLYVYQPFAQLGKVSLLIYLLHFTLIHEVISPMWGIRFMENDTKQPFPSFVMVYLALAGALIGVAYLVNRYKGQWKNKPYVVQLLIGS
jgi:uncharacterized membrane protein